MKKKVEVREISIKTILICDICGEDKKKIKSCAICGRDVCEDCSILTDYWCLEAGEWTYDHPSYYCRECWKRGEDIIKEILELRKKQEELWDRWKGGLK